MGKQRKRSGTTGHGRSDMGDNSSNNSNCREALGDGRFSFQFGTVSPNLVKRSQVCKKVSMPIPPVPKQQAPKTIASVPPIPRMKSKPQKHPPEASVQFGGPKPNLQNPPNCYVPQQMFVGFMSNSQIHPAKPYSQFQSIVPLPSASPPLFFSCHQQHPFLHPCFMSQGQNLKFTPQYPVPIAPCRVKIVDPKTNKELKFVGTNQFSKPALVTVKPPPVSSAGNNSQNNRFRQVGILPSPCLHDSVSESLRDVLNSLESVQAKILFLSRLMSSKNVEDGLSDHQREKELGHGPAQISIPVDIPSLNPTSDPLSLPEKSTILTEPVEKSHLLMEPRVGIFPSSALDDSVSVRKVVSEFKSSEVSGGEDNYVAAESVLHVKQADVSCVTAITREENDDPKDENGDVPSLGSLFSKSPNMGIQMRKDQNVAACDGDQDSSTVLGASSSGTTLKPEVEPLPVGCSECFIDMAMKDKRETLVTEKAAGTSSPEKQKGTVSALEGMEEVCAVEESDRAGDDFENTADKSRRMVNASEREHINGDGVMNLNEDERRKYSCDFLLQFEHHCTALPYNFDAKSDLEALIVASGNANVQSVQGNDGNLRNQRPPISTAYPPMQSAGSVAGLHADRWQQAPLLVTHKAEKKYQVGKVRDEQEAKQRQLKSILNKLTPQNFSKLFEQVKTLKIDNGVTLAGIISQIFDKALMEPTFCEMYADFCSHLSLELSDVYEKDDKISFKVLLLNKCQEEFEREQEEGYDNDNDAEDGETKARRDEKRMKARRRMLGNIRLIGELYKKRMLSDRIMHICIDKLLGKQYDDPDEQDIEALCKLMSTIGQLFDTVKCRGHMDSYFQSMYAMSNNKKLSSRVRFMLKDSIELRKNNWQQRRKIDGPKKIEEVHRDAAQERLIQANGLSSFNPCAGRSMDSGGPNHPIPLAPQGGLARRMSRCAARSYQGVSHLKKKVIASPILS